MWSSVAPEYKLLGLLRLSLGWIFLWTCLDKFFGLGFSTAPEQSVLQGVSPTFGYLAFATNGPFASLFQALAGHPVIDGLFMLGMLLIGLALMLGIGVRVAGYSGALMMLLIFLAASLPPEHNPILDEHIIYALALLLFTRLPVGNYLGLGAWWSQTSLATRYPWLR